jgi:hypothetical protein
MLQNARMPDSPAFTTALAGRCQARRRNAAKRPHLLPRSRVVAKHGVAMLQNARIYYRARGSLPSTRRNAAKRPQVGFARIYYPARGYNSASGNSKCGENFPATEIKAQVGQEN